MSIQSGVQSTVSRSSNNSANAKAVIPTGRASSTTSSSSTSGQRSLDDVRDQVAGELAVRAIRKAKSVSETGRENTNSQGAAGAVQPLGVKIGVTFTLAKQDEVQFLQTVADTIQNNLLLRSHLFAIATTGAPKRGRTANTLIICGSSEEYVQRALLLVSHKFIGRVESAVNEGVRWVAAVRDMGSSSYDEAALWDVLRKSARTLSDPLSPPPGSLSIAQILSRARSKLQRLTPAQAYNELHDPDYPMPVFLVDIRPAAQREREGGIEGSLIIERNVLEWRFDPRSDARLPIADRYDSKIIIYCQEGYTSSLAAASLQEMDDLAYHMTAHLRMNAIYWGLTALCVMGHKDALDRDEMIEFVMSCWDEEAGAFGAHPDHDAHLLSTLSAIQILITQDALDRVDIPRVTKFIISLQQPSGVFAGDFFGEVDTRFLFCAVNALSLLGQLDKLDVDKTVSYIRQCRNFDGGFGAQAGAESHASQVFVCVAALAILDKLDEIDHPTLSWWLAERQLPNGGLNGRPEKLEDVCYSFWVLSSLSILNKLSWIDSEKLTAFILSSQEFENGGIADRPGDMPDVFHTLFGLAGLSLLGYPGLADLDPVYCMPAQLIESRGLRKGWKALERRAN
ncbi:hypothetical protein HWV62_12556 [Athelia sp. TMB]|nr:hypothetical protein HWV62_12556 [Athelia sp. TMB]